ncbi:MAG: site-specific integrase [Micrococcaceae bacterium]
MKLARAFSNALELHMAEKATKSLRVSSRQIGSFVPDFLVFAESYYSSSFFPACESFFRQFMAHSISKKRLDRVNVKAISALYNDLFKGKNRALSTMEKARTFLVKFYDYLMAQQYCYINYPTLVDLPAQYANDPIDIVPFSPDEMKSFLARVKQVNPYVAAICEFLTLTGLRIGELQALTVTDVKYANGFYYLDITKGLVNDNNKNMHVKKYTKNGTTRQVPLCERAVELLKTYARVDFKASKNILWASPQGVYFRRTNITRSGQLRKLSGAHPHLFHSFRHYYISNLTNAGVPEPQICLLTGHKTLSVMETLW